MSTHTPGPWMVEPVSDDFDGAVSVVSEYSVIGQKRIANWIAECDLQDERVEENHANARLIAAAPDLLNACKEALLWFGPDGDHVTDPARALLVSAIAKAEPAS